MQMVVKPAIEHIGGRVVAPSTTLTPLTVNTGDSLTVKGTVGRAFIAGAWSKSQTSGDVQIYSPRMHDQKNGFQYTTVTGDPYTYWPNGSLQEVFPQDAITVNMSGSATAGDFELTALLFYYFNYSGIEQNLIHWKELWRRKKYDVTLKTSITGGAGGGYTGSVNLNASTVYNLKANTQYAILGMHINTPCCSVVWQGPDLGNLRVGIPANSVNKDVTREWFVRMSHLTDLPFIPLINAANGGATSVQVMCDENAGTFVVNTILAELR